MKPDRTKYPQNSGFDVPENYFESLEDRIMQKLEHKQLDLPARDGSFKVPDGYFDSLEERILQKAGKTETKVVKLIRREYLYYAAAVAAIIILMFGNFFQSNAVQTIGWEDVEISAIENYIDEGYEMGYIDLNTADYSEFIFEDGKLVGDEDFNRINPQAAMDYLDENIEDPSYIMD